MNKIQEKFQKIGPGFIVAATGVGAGDMIAATVSGAKFGMVILWAAVVGAILKYVLNEGVARWQLVTGETLIQSWTQRFPRIVSHYFLLYLILWSFVVAGALMAACGLAAHAILPQLSVTQWGVLHSLFALALVWLGSYSKLENIMKIFIALMFIVVVISAILTKPDIVAMLKGLFIPSLPDGSAKFLLGVIGGVGGSVTLLSYGYWIREKKWSGSSFLSTSRFDLATAYFFTAIFGVSIMIIAAGVSPEIVTGSGIIVGLSNKMGELLGEYSRWIFLAGFWGAVFSSMLGVWQGVPYLFNDLWTQMKLRSSKSPVAKTESTTSEVHSKYYRGFLLFLALPPMVLLLVDKPVWIVIIYSIAGAFFMPFLAGLLLYMNNRIKWVGKFTNTVFYIVGLVVCILLFVYISYTEIAGQFGW